MKKIKTLVGLTMQQWQTVYDKYPFATFQEMMVSKWEYKMHKRWTIPHTPVTSLVTTIITRIVEEE